MSAPKLTNAQRREVASRYADGESMPALAEAYGVGVTCIDRTLKLLGIRRRSLAEAALLVRSELVPCRECGAGTHPNAVKPLCPACAKRFCQSCDGKLPQDWHTRLCPPCKFAHRYRNKPPRLCRICGRMGARGTKRDLCAVHVKLYCSVCEAHMPPGRVNHRCTGCEQARKVDYWERPGARCSQCGEERDGNHASRCRKCVAEDYEVLRWAILHRERPCVHCGTVMPKGRRLNRCGPCHGKEVRRRRQERQALGAHRCALCAEPLGLNRDTYCGGCGQMLANWRKAWHEGNKIARQLGTVRPHRKWQEPERRAA